MSPGGGDGPEREARQHIDAALGRCGWVVQDRAAMNVHAGQGVAVREFALGAQGYADYLLFVNGEAVGALEAKPAGFTLSGVETQVAKYSEGLPEELDAPVRPLPFLYLSTGVETRFTNLLDPKPRSRPVFSIHRPETLAEWLDAKPLPAWAEELPHASEAVAEAREAYGEADSRPATLRGRLQVLPPVSIPNLWQNKVEAITKLEASLRDDRPRALIQMATGSGKTMLAVTALYRLIKFAGVRRALFLVDRANLGEQAEKEFKNYRTPDDNRKFDELYNVQLLQSNTIGSSSKVVITTIQRLYSMLKGEPEFDPAAEETSQFEEEGAQPAEPLPVVYNEAIPPEYFDVIVIDECHRSIYTLWRQVLDYFDAYLVGLTATPAKHTFGFFNQNLVMEYPHEQAVADGVNCDFEVYKIRTRITEQGSKIEAGHGVTVGLRDRDTRAVRWKKADEDVAYTAKDLDKTVVAKDQIRLIIRTFKERLFTEILPGREDVPKTLIFAKDDSHAEDIVDVVREEFAEGNAFCQKITYKTTGAKPSDLIQDFRNSYMPRIAVTVDMIATGTDIKPIEIVMFMRTVKSRVLFEQMKGRGVRIIDDTDLKSVTRDAKSKTHFVIVDCVGLTESEMSDTQPLERKRTVSFSKLMEHVAAGGSDPDMLSSLASRLARLDKQCGSEERARVQEAAGGASLKDIAGGIVHALDPDRQVAEAREAAGLAPDAEPTEEQVRAAGKKLLREAAKPLAAAPELRTMLQDLKRKYEQVLDEVSKDELLEAGTSESAREKARALTQDFERFLAENKDEIEALQFFYSQPYSRRLKYSDIKLLAEEIKAPPRSWTPDRLWRAYELLEADKVRGASSGRLLTDLVSLIKFALHQDEELTPYGQQVRDRFESWMAQQQSAGRDFTEEQVHWLEMIRDHVGTSLEFELDDFDMTPFVEEGGLGRARKVFGEELGAVLRELNEALAA